MADGTLDDDDLLPDPAITPQLFRKWRSPTFGRSNPERMNNPVWEWLIRSRLSAYQANEQMKGPSDFQSGPGWCFSRFGQSSTPLTDGRTVLIAGEHEDHYDPDFYIYNDVVVQHPDGRLDIFGYPRTVFPPTDFHSATLVGGQIVIVGCLGYPADRRPGKTPIYLLELDSFAICSVAASGAPPGWIYKHEAQLADDGKSLLIQRGMLERGDGETQLENIDDWCLHLMDWRWERLTKRTWQRWEFIRADRAPNHLWQYVGASMYRSCCFESEFRESVENLTAELGTQPDLTMFPNRYVPPVAHESLPDRDDEFGVARICVEGVTVRYVEGTYSVQMTVEGDLPQVVIDALVDDLQNKLERLENSPHIRRRL